MVLRRRAFAFSLAFKLRIIKLHFEARASITSLSKIYHIERKVIRQWIKTAQKIKESRYRLKRCRIKRKISPRFPDFENELKNWIREARDNGRVVSGRAIKARAMQLAVQMKLSNFNCSSGKLHFNFFKIKIESLIIKSGWLYKFLSRANLSLRRITTNGRELPANTKEVIKQYIDECKTQIKDKRVPSSSVFNMDQTTIYIDTFGNKKCFYFLLKISIFN